ncbi:MAG: gliding motility-associated C-terminal domain-containing protein [Saprospiraceae bacterium]|nr:gliding motility-associated C-terminal domain-containing protein [Saprospiraceae bacterium]MDW8230355.1 gliding motility-associated C-terminal domain-containing protein [Saprospiraceae bacterium]
MKNLNLFLGLLLPLLIGTICSLSAQPANDRCANALVIAVDKGGYGYGVFTSDTVDITQATAEPGEYFDFAPSHAKSVWYRFTLSTRRKIQLNLKGTNLADIGLTLYRTAPNCLPGQSSLVVSSKGDAGGSVEITSCMQAGVYRVQITAPATVSAQVYVELTLSCREDPITAPYDCPSNAYVFNNGAPLVSGTTYTVPPHAILCHSIEDTTEYACLPLTNKATYKQSLWYVFRANTPTDLVQVMVDNYSTGPTLGYRLLRGDVRAADPAALEVLACGTAVADQISSRRRIDLACVVVPGEFHSLALFFPENYTQNNFQVHLSSRGYAVTGWPNISQPPALAQNQLGTLAPGTTVTLRDGFDCNALIKNNPCPPAHPSSGQVRIYKAPDSLMFDLTTWASFSLTTQANVFFRLDSSNLYVRVFRKPASGACPDPSTDLVLAFADTAGRTCLAAGDYLVQILGTVVNARIKASSTDQIPWHFGKLGTPFSLRIQVKPAAGEKFALRTASDFNAINGMQVLQNNTIYTADSAVIACDNTVLPEDLKCTGATRAIYRQVRVSGGGILRLINLRTDHPNWKLRYQLFQADASALASAQDAHQAGETIKGMSDYLGFCISDYQSNTTPGIDTFCVCVRDSSVFTLVTLGDSSQVEKGDRPGFQFRSLTTKYNSRANAETITVPVPGTVQSDIDVFSCEDNVGNLPTCGNRRKAIFRQFYLPSPAVVSIGSWNGSYLSPFSLFSGRASDTAATLTPIRSCNLTQTFYDYCNPLPAGWYTIVSYGDGPNYTDKRALNSTGRAEDVGKTSIVRITTEAPRTPRYNRPHKAFYAGVTDWQTPPANNPNAQTARTYNLGTEWFCAPDTPFIPAFISNTCASGYNRVAFYTFTITKKSFIAINELNNTFHTQLFPFDVRKDSQLLKTTSPIYPCVRFDSEYRQICNVPPGNYTLVVFANNSHEGGSISPSLYVEMSELSRFDDISSAYDFDLIPGNNTWYHGKPGDTHPTLQGQHPSRDVITCNTGVRTTDPPAPCRPAINPLVYSPSHPNPLYLPQSTLSQSARNIWYTFALDGPGTLTININKLSPDGLSPIAVLFESSLDANLPWPNLGSLGDSLLSKKLFEVRRELCPRKCYFLFFPTHTDECIGCSSVTWEKLTCGKKRYFLMLEFDPYQQCNNAAVFPNVTVSVSVRFNTKALPAPLYDERAAANVINGQGQTQPPYASAPLALGQTFTGADLYLPCYTAAPTDPPGCPTKRTAWYRFEVASAGTLDVALKRKNADMWVANPSEITLWQENAQGQLSQTPLGVLGISGDHRWLSGCVEPGTYYLLVRECTFGASAPPDTLQVAEAYQPVIRLNHWAGDFCSNAIPINVSSYNTHSGSAIVTCHTVGTDVGEESAARMGCLRGPAGRKTTWFRIQLTAGTKNNLRFSLSEELAGTDVLSSDLAYRVYAGSCGAMTPLLCSADGGAIITQNCLGPGEYYVQVSTPTTAKNLPVAGRITFQVTAQPNTQQACTPIDPSAIRAAFDPIVGCHEIGVANNSTSGTDIAYLWQFPDGTTSTAVEPTWTPPASGAYTIHLQVTKKSTNQVVSTSRTVVFSKPFDGYQPLRDTFFCNTPSTVVLDATLAGASYVWSNQATTPSITVQSPGVYTVQLLKNGCELRDTAIVSLIEAKRVVNATLCPEDTLYVNGQAFYRSRPNGLVTLPGAHPLGCDSLLTVNLQFYPETVQFLDTVLCADKTFSVGGTTFSVQHPKGTVWLPGQAPHGCALKVNVSATFTPIPRRTVERTLCPGETWVFAGEVFSEARPSDTIWLATAVAGGCDTAVWVKTHYYYPDTARITVQTCEDTYVFLGNTLTPRHPDQMIRLKNATSLGCDSFVHIRVNFLPRFTTNYQPVLCPGETISVGNEVFSAQRLTGVVLLTAANGCDSTVHVQATALPPAIGYVSGAYCFEDTVHLFGRVFTRHKTRDTIIRPGLAPHGCDSIWIVSLEFRGFAHTRTTQTACLGSTVTLNAPAGGIAYRWHNGASTAAFSVTNSGLYWVETQDDLGCVVRRDSFEVYFQPLSPPQGLPAVTCKDETAALQAQGSTTGTYRWFATPTGGVLLGEGPVWQSGPLAQDTVFWVETYDPAVAGCISQRTPVSVRVHPTYHYSVQASTCENEPYRFGGQWLNASGVYTQRLKSIHGCDSIVTLTLTVRDTFVRRIFVTLCYDESYRLPDNRVIEQPGSYWVKLRTQQDCDSSILFEVSKLPLFVSTNSIALCKGRVHVLPWGDTATQAGVYRHTARYSNGCDSLRMTVIVVDAPPVALSNSTVSWYGNYNVSCADAADGRITLNPSQGSPPYSAVWSHGSSQLFLAGLSAGTYSVTVSDSKGCTGTASFQLHAPPPLSVEKEVISPLCPGETRGRISLEAQGGVAPYLYGINQKPLTSRPFFTNLVPGLYHLVVEDANGCEVITEATIEPPLPLKLSIEPALLRVRLGDSLQLKPDLNFIPDSIAWQASTGVFSCANCLTPWIKPTQSASYQLQAWSQEGCLLSARVKVAVEKDMRFYAPNAFRPDSGGGENAFFSVYTGPEVTQIKRLAVFDRWGSLVFEAIQFAPGATEGYWDGRINGQEGAPGVYTWLCVIELVNGEEEVFRGDVSLLR